MKTTIVPASHITDWLLKCGKFDVQPVTVRIEDESWRGFRYKQTGTYTAGMDACTRGDKKPGETWTDEMVYCLGKLSKCKRKRRRYDKVCFPCKNDGLDWYVAAYIEEIKPAFAESHPFGISFILSPWKVPGGEKIDQHERKPYDRHEVTFSTE